jgi:hypothetical protein
MNWKDFEAASPELAAFGRQRLHGKVAYLATAQKSGAPRVHPVTPEIGEGHLFVFMEPTSPKGKDLQRSGSYALHCGVSDTTGESGEFWCMGHATLIQDPTVRATAARISSYSPAEHYILFELSVERAQSTVYENHQAVRTSWKEDVL